MSKASWSSERSANATSGRSRSGFLAKPGLLGSALLGLWLLGSPSAEAAVPKGGYHPLQPAHMTEMRRELRSRVALLAVPEKPIPGLVQLSPDTYAFALPLDARRLATVPQLADAETVKVIGPKGETRARRRLVDLDRRVAIFEAETPLDAIGLQVSRPSPKAGLKVGQDVFALASLEPEAGIQSAVMTRLAEVPEDEGCFESELKLGGAMPIFDAYLGVIGYARSVAWDTNKGLIVPLSKIDEAVAEAQKPPAPPKKPARPWWAK